MNTPTPAENVLLSAHSACHPGLASRVTVSSKSRNKTWQYLAVFSVLTLIYFCYFVWDARANACPPEDSISVAQLGWRMLRFFLLTSWPFAFAAAMNPDWSSRDAGNVFLGAFFVTNLLWYFKTGCAPCIFAAAFSVIPYVFCAMIAHGLGTVRHRFRLPSN